jgi:hypothetical protein
LADIAVAIVLGELATPPADADHDVPVELDAITAFAVPNPNCPSQSRRFFQVWLPSGLPRRADHSAYFGLAKV